MPTKAELEVALAAANQEVERRKGQLQKTVDAIMEYDGCYEGRKDFVTDNCGIEIAATSPWVQITLLVKVDPSALLDARDDSDLSTFLDVMEGIDDDGRIDGLETSYVLSGTVVEETFALKAIRERNEGATRYPNGDPALADLRVL